MKILPKWFTAISQVVIILFITTLPSFAQNVKFKWYYDSAKQYSKDQLDSSKWDTALLRNDGPMEFSADFPIQIGSFPVDHYKSPGNGSTNLEFEISGKKLFGVAVFIGKGNQNSNIFKSAKEAIEVPFIILYPNDTAYGGGYLVTSRNHPNYVAEGRITAKDSLFIDWVSMQLADRNAYAIINMRLFDLRCGRVIITAPQRNKTLRFFQVATPSNILVGGTDIKTIVNNIKSAIFSAINNPDVAKFINQYGK